MPHTIRSIAGASILSLALAGFAVRAEEVKLPQTADEHLAIAKSYEEKAATWRKEATYHHKMAAAYKKSHPDPKGTRDVETEAALRFLHEHEAAKMAKHCAAIAKRADKLAADAEEVAKYHRHRAEELQGK